MNKNLHTKKSLEGMQINLHHPNSPPWPEINSYSFSSEFSRLEGTWFTLGNV